MVAALEHLKPAVCVVDSVQTLWSTEVGSTPGSVAQIRDATAQLLRVAKDNGIALVLVGHVTKDGELAGPRVLEHMVDAVLSFEGERAQPFRILRAVKNRFGSTNEVGVFQMAEQGLVEVPDPASVFLEEGDLRSGSVVVPVLEGTRCLLGRSAGAGGSQQPGHAAAGGAGRRPQPPGHDRGRSQPAGAAAAAQMRHLC